MEFRELIFVLFVLGVATGCATGVPQVEPGCLTVEQALARVTSQDGVEVSVCGVLRYRSEDRNLYSSEEAAANHSRRQCISVGESAESTANLEGLDGAKVMLKGVASTNFCPPDTLCLGSCSDTGIFVRSAEMTSDDGRSGTEF